MTGIFFLYKKRKLGHRLTQREEHVKTQGKRWPSTSQGDRPRKKPTLPTPWSETSSLQNCGEINFCRLSRPICGTLLWQPCQAHTLWKHLGGTLSIRRQPGCLHSVNLADRKISASLFFQTSNLTLYFHALRYQETSSNSSPQLL